MPHAPNQFLLQLLVIFASAKVVGELFERIKLPSVLGEILAGAALGPYALAWIVPSDTTHSVAEIGAIFVLFSAGLETSPQDLIRVGRQSAPGRRGRNRGALRSWICLHEVAW
jgi:Kef-type K+ transport system membrane component KefB